MKQLLISIGLLITLCQDGQDVVKVPTLFPGAQMEITACGLDMDGDRNPDVILLYANDEEGSTLIKALMPREYLDAVYPEYPPEEGVVN